MLSVHLCNSWKPQQGEKKKESISDEESSVGRLSILILLASLFFLLGFVDTHVSLNAELAQRLNYEPLR